MATPWPAQLQQRLNSQGFSMTPGETTIRSNVDGGPAKVRSRYTYGIDQWTASIYMPYSDYTILMNFYKTSLANGSLPFTMNHPFTGVPTDFRFLNPPTLTTLGNGGIYFQVSWNMESMP